MSHALLAMLLASATRAASPPPTADETALQHSIEQLRTSVGRWEVVTECLGEDGSVARSVTGMYEFSWVVRDRVVTGRSELPELEQVSGILFYVREAKQQIEMVSVGADSRLWIMTGPLGGEERLSQEYKTADRGTGRLRFTRSNITEDAFDSRMEWTDDDGASWKPGNRQRFTRAAPTR